MGKGTYKNLVTIPDSNDTPIVGGGKNSGTGGDIVANFKAIADVIYPENKNDNGEEVSFESSGSIITSWSSDMGDSAALNVGCNFNYSPGGTSYHILNNTVSTSSVSNLKETAASDSRFGVQSGAFMKGVQCPLSTGTAVRLFDVPYAGGMLVEYHIIAFDNTNVHIRKGTLYIYMDGVTSSNDNDSLTGIGSFSVVNGDLLFTPSANWPIAQFGLHGTVLSGLHAGLASNYQSISISG